MIIHYVFWWKCLAHLVAARNNFTPLQPKREATVRVLIAFGTPFGTPSTF